MSNISQAEAAWLYLLDQDRKNKPGLPGMPGAYFVRFDDGSRLFYNDQQEWWQHEPGADLSFLKATGQT